MKVRKSLSSVEARNPGRRHNAPGFAALFVPGAGDGMSASRDGELALAYSLASRSAGYEWPS
jgi:hypothetical protein